MRFSVFAKCGHLRLTSKPSDAELLYTSKIAGLGDQFNVTEGSRMDALCYAQAMGEARMRRKLDRAVNQQYPSRLVDCLEKREAEFQVVPSPGDTVTQRRATLEARYLLPLGCNKNNVENALTSLLGPDFIAYRTTTTSEAVLSPPAIGGQPMNLQRTDVTRKRVTFIDPVTTTALPVVIRYSLAEGVALTDADALVVEPETRGITETVAVTHGYSSTVLKFATVTTAVTTTGAHTVNYTQALGATPLAEGDVLGFILPTEYVRIDAITATTLTATFSKLHTFLTPTGIPVSTWPGNALVATFANAHGVGCIGTTMPYPYWSSTKRHSLIVLTAAAAASLDVRRKVHALMKRIAREVSTWEIVVESTPGHTGAFIIGTSTLGGHTLGDITY
jgi:hypothetical protein